MKWNKGLGFTILTMVFGFMLAVQFLSIKEPAVRDTRDMWEIREDLKKEQQLGAQMLSEIRKYEEMLKSYEEQENQNPERALKDALQQLKVKAGVTEAEGPGIEIMVEPLFSGEVLGKEIQSVPPELLKRLINELNSYGAEQISISGRRYINTSVIRDINGVTKIDGYSLNNYPIILKVISSDADKLYNRLSASNTDENFAIDNLSLKISQPRQSVKVPGYEDSIRVKQLKPVKASEGGAS
ncbi:DUF881 domain-containing protein [Bacillus lacus]|uniref:DUF881 domain-containing protein n=1 Tax=Metabacillus lacus TaxID=1983721 RepID=A0A7X2IVY6_9BACI|nr:DUF881 domain-containing protein [Metabacillus lacus]MRX70803.1 DUF881 domain-containing protein [Metabacillus lacus]